MWYIAPYFVSIISHLPCEVTVAIFNPYSLRIHGSVSLSPNCYLISEQGVTTRSVLAYRVHIGLMNCSSLSLVLWRDGAAIEGAVFCCAFFVCNKPFICRVYVGCRCLLYKLRTLHTVFSVSELANTSSQWASVRTNKTRLSMLRQGRRSIP
jgi:hypothetical protein